MDPWKNELKKAFEAPRPVRKKEFLRQLDPVQVTVPMFLVSQIGYIRKWVWGISVLIFAGSAVGLLVLPGAVLWFISGSTPLLALTLLSESGRSELHHMAELEMATRFSLRSVLLARLAILGLADLLLLGILFPIGLYSGPQAPFAAALYIVTPFLLTTFLGLSVTRKLRGQEAMYVCAAISLGISLFLFLSHNVVPYIYQEQHLTAWGIAAAALLFGNGKQCAAMMKKTEEFSWNLS